MKLVFIEEGFEILLDSSEIEYTRSSTIFSPLSGEWSYPFTLKATEEVLEKLNYPNLQNLLADYKKIYVVQLVDASFLHAQGNFELQYADDEIITATMTATPGNISKKIWAKKLNTFDLGGDTIPEQNINNTVYKLGALEQVGNYESFGFGAGSGQTDFKSAIDRIFFKTNIQFKIGSTTFINETVEPAHSELLEGSNSIFQAILDSYNTGQNQNEILYDEKQLLCLFSGARTENLEIVFTFFVLNGSDDVRQISTFVLAPAPIKTITNYLNGSLLNTWTKPYQLPEVFNSKHYLESSGFNGVINKTDAGNIIRNASILLEKTKYSLVPMLSLKWVLEKLFQLQGYTISGTFLQHNDVQKMLIFNLYTTDKTIEGVSYPINIHNPIITYANHLPAETLEAYCQAIIDEFGLCFEFNSLTKTLDISFLSDILAENEVLDLTGRLSRKRRNNLLKGKKTQAKWTISGDGLAKDDASPYLPEPLNSVVEEQPDDYEPLDLKIPGLIGDNNKKPRIEANCISPIFEQTKNTSPLRLIFWDNNMGKVETDTLSFDLKAAKGVYQKFLKTKIEYANKALNTEAFALMSKQEILSFKFKRKIAGFGVFWLAEELQVKFKANQEFYQVELKLKRINYS